MEKSIKRVEKLVHATNSALAQMKFSLMFDDVSGDGNGKACAAKGFDTLLGEAFLDGDDLRRCQSEFKSEANETLSKMESAWGSNESSRKNAKAVDRIKEINRKMNRKKMEQSKREETEQSRQKLLDLLSEERFSPGVASSRDSIRSKQTIQLNKEKKSAPKKTDAPAIVTKSPNKSAEELKSKILETQEIVNRGFHTARQLAQKVDTMSKCERKEKTPSTEKTASEINIRSPESNDTASTVKCRRCAKKKRTKSEEKVERVDNARVIEVKRSDPERRARSNLRVQRLPSVHIKGELQIQRIHSLEIPAGGDAARAKSNTAINFLSHERMESEKMGESIDKVRKENACCTGGDARGNYVECFNCGKFIRIRDTRVDPRRVDEILQKCNFDVFDPRIDEFVERCASGVNRWKEELPDAVLPPEPEPVEPEEAPKETGPKVRDPPKKAHSTLQSLSEKLLKMYRQEADTIESNHLKLDNILQNLFRQVDESREVFEKCNFLRNRNSESGPKLTATEPVVVSLTGTSFGAGKRERKLKADRKKVESKTEVEPRGAPCPAETIESGGRVSLLYFNGNRKSGTREVPREVIVTSNKHRSSPKPLEIGKVRRASSVSSSATSSSTSDARSCDPLKNVSGKEDEETPSTRHRSTKTASEKEEEHRKTPEALTEDNGKLPEAKKEDFEEEKVPSETLSSSSSKEAVQTDAEKRGTLLSSLFRARLSEAVFGKTDTEKKSVTSPTNGKATSETSSEKSENNYESDFESMTNEPNEVVGECEDEEPEVNLGVNKLSTISEVDSEMEKKLSDEQRTLRSSRNIEMEEAAPKDVEEREGDVCLPVRREGDSTAVETSSESKKSEATPPKRAEASAKSTPTELVTSLKDILSVLQDQFVRTESLAEKLTENARSEAKASILASDSWKKTEDARLVENLRSARKDSGGSKTRGPPDRPSGKSPEEKAASADGLSDEGGSSLGEIVRSDRRRKTPEKSESSSISEWIASDGREENPAPVFGLDVDSEEVLYSEGEIPSDELLHRFRSSSIGEVISGKNSIASSSGLKDEN